MSIAFLLDAFERAGSSDAIIFGDGSVTYERLISEVDRWSTEFAATGLEPGSVVSLEADFSPCSVAALLALIERRAIVVPLSKSVEANKPEFREIAEIGVIVEIDDRDEIRIKDTGRQPTHPLLADLKERGRPGLVLFSSGSTGKSKAALHDLVPILEKFTVRRHTLRTITFLLFDHIGGFNTLMYSLSNGGCIITVHDRSPDAICRMIDRCRAELLPTSPTFLNLLLASEAYDRHDLSSLRLITYGTEVMPVSTLQRLRELLPNVRLQQTYGLSEVGILRSKSRSSDSLWVKIGGEGFETRVVDGLLEIRAQSAMLGYLNAPSPFTADGWFRTGDAVEVDGDYVKFLGRRSEVINVGGEKVFPAAVESLLQSMDGVIEAVVHGEPNPITGQVISAEVNLSTGESLRDFRRRMSRFFLPYPRHLKPHRVSIVSDKLHGDRFKKVREAKS